LPFHFGNPIITSLFSFGKEKVDLELQVSKEPDAKPGLKCQAIDFYISQNSGPWTQQYLTHYEEAAENIGTTQSAILKRNVKSSDSRKKFDLHSIAV
jgi:hypothetical protein